MADESSIDGKRLVELFKQACSMTGSEQEAFVRRIQEENTELAKSVAELLRQGGRVPPEPGSFAKKLEERYGSEADPQISLEGESEGSDFASEIVQRLAGRGETYGRYRLKGEVARGGQGAILRVWDEDLRRNLAMKVVLGKGEPTGETPHIDSKTLGRFLEEAQVTGQLDHPGIVPVHELGLDDQGQVYFTMKLVKGRDLKAIFGLVGECKEGWRQTRALNVLLKVCEAMAYAHSKGVIHRDLKPSNVMVGKYGEVYIMDWGLARVLDREDEKDIRIKPQATTSELHTDRKEATSDDSPLITMDGDVVGTPAYMSPEQARGDLKAMGPHSDVYAAGAMLYHLLAGHMPYVRPGERANNYAIWRWVNDGPPTSLVTEAPDTPAELTAICDKAMARDPANRYPDMAALAEDLRAFLEDRVVGAYETGAWAETKKWVRRNKPLAASLAAAVVLLVAGLLTALVLRQQAVSSAKLAKTNEEEAKKQELIAKKRAEDILSLAAFQKLEDLEREADELWPPHPEHLGAYDTWIAKAEELVAGLARDPTSDDIGHRARLAALRETALPWTEADREAARLEHPRFGEIEPLRDQIAALRAAQQVRAGRAQVSEPLLDPDALPEDAGALLELAGPLVDPERSRFGDEARGLALVRLALERVEDDAALAKANETLAWALFATGQDAEAVEEMAVATGLAPEELQARMTNAQSLLRAAVEEVKGAKGEERIADLEHELALLEEEVNGQREWHFEDEEDRWWHNQLALLVSEIEAFADAEAGPWKGISPDHGWGVELRRAFASKVKERTVSGAEVAAKWAAAAKRVAANPKYAGVNLIAQLGLVPLGPDPDSGLEEFGHPLTGAVPARDEQGGLVVTEEMGLVFVLLPGGKFWMGAQKRDRNARKYDPQAENNEGPVHEVALSPFFLSKYEMTQAQWMRFQDHNPSNYQPGNVARSLLHPVEQVNWWTSRDACVRMGLSLPTEAQWEYGARGGTNTVWWTGNEAASLGTEKAANMADQTAKLASSWAVLFEAWDDKHTIHAPVNTFAANPFGLYDVHGNVWEWCLDGYVTGFYGISSKKDPLSEPSSSSFRVSRGGSFYSPAVFARLADRNYYTPEHVDFLLGLRPARALRAR